MGPMMTGCMMSGTPMMFGMAFFALLLLATLALVAGAALKYMRSASPAGNCRPSFVNDEGGR